MSVRLGVFLCTGYGIRDALDLDALRSVAVEEFQVEVCETLASCASDDLAALRERALSESLTHVVLAGPSSRNYDARDLNVDLVVVAVNLLEWVIQTHPPGHEDTQRMAEDYLRMGIVRARYAEVPVPFEQHARVNKTILVVGGGVAGLAAAHGAAGAGYDVVLVEKQRELGGYFKQLYRSIPTRPPYQYLEETDIAQRIDEVNSNRRVTVYTGSTIQSTRGAPGFFEVTLRRDGGTAETFAVGAIVQATGFEPCLPFRRHDPDFASLRDVVTSTEFEEMARNGDFRCPSNDEPARRVAFVESFGSRDPETFSFTSSITSLNAVKQAFYLRERDATARADIILEQLRAPGQHEQFLRRAQQDPGIHFERGSVVSVSERDGAIVLDVRDDSGGEPVALEADLVVLSEGMKPVSADGESLRRLAENKSVIREGSGHDRYEAALAQVEALASHEGTEILGLDYRQGPDLPALAQGYPDSHFICFPYETRRTGIYAAGTVRSPMDGASSAEDGMGAALKAIQCVEMLARGESVHPRSGHVSFLHFALDRCTLCKRCTEECPFGSIDDDGTGMPLYNVTRCRHCGICLGCCPERIINFPDYSVIQVVEMIKAVHVPEADEEKPRVLVLACENDAVPALERAAFHGRHYSPFVRILPVPCLGSCNAVWIKTAISAGFDGVLLLGCRSGENYQCHFMSGSDLMGVRGDSLRETLGRMSMENDRVRLHEVEITNFAGVPRLIDEFLQRIDEIGLNPFKGL
ncbi:MAG: hydrogenase iron-sulfur subunit [Planctomycetota bacterium]|jgi:quinone-modifying oxidoreductase subunit QmoB